MKPERLAGLTLLLLGSSLQAETPVLTRFIDHGSDRAPKHTVAPEYPHAARRDRIEGQVQVCYNIDRQGRPYRIAVRSSTHRIFEKPARRAVKASTYVPLKHGETRTGIKTCRTFRFELEPVVADNKEPPA